MSADPPGLHKWEPVLAQKGSPPLSGSSGVLLRWSPENFWCGWRRGGQLGSTLSRPTL